jgi:hypothetical protein
VLAVDGVAPKAVRAMQSFISGVYSGPEIVAKQGPFKL